MDEIFQLYRQVAGPEIGWRDRHVFLGQGLELRSPFNDLRVSEMLASTPHWVKQHTGMHRGLLRAALERAGLPEIAARKDKGHYAEQAIAGVVRNERPRVAAGLASASLCTGVRSDISGREK